MKKGKIPKRWQEVLSKIESKEEANHKLAIIEADVLLDGVLAKMGYLGETLSEKLEKIQPSALSTVSELRQAHYVKNNILHDPDFNLSPQKAREVIDSYEKVLKELDVL